MPATAKTVTAREPIIDFSPVELRAPFLLRFGALLIDYMILLILPVGGLLYSRLVGDPTPMISYRTLWFLSVILFLGNIIVLPIPQGRSIGKLLTGLQIVRNDGTRANALHILLRQTIGYLLTAVTLGLGFLISAFNVKGLALQDLLSGTIVVQARRRVN